MLDDANRVKRRIQKRYAAILGEADFANFMRALAMLRRARTKGVSTRHPRPTNGILVAMMFTNSALASGGRVAMKTMVSATFCTSMRGSGTVCPFGCNWPDDERSVIGVSALPTSTWPQAMS